LAEQEHIPKQSRQAVHPANASVANSNSLPAVPVVNQLKQNTETESAEHSSPENTVVESFVAPSQKENTAAPVNTVQRFHPTVNESSNGIAEGTVQQFKKAETPVQEKADEEKTSQPAFTPYGTVAQLRGGKGRKARRAAERRATRGHRNANRRQQAANAREAEEAQGTIAAWGSWALEQLSGVVSGAMKKKVGVDPIEIAGQLKAIAGAQVSIKSKIVYLATYGTLKASEFLKDNLASIIGGDVGAMMELEDDVNEQLSQCASLWEAGEVTPDMLEDQVKDQIISALSGEDE
jgi:hypothetical protein